MTANEIKAALITAIDLSIAEFGGDTTLNQDELNNTTNGIIEVVNTVNPTAPTYPPKGM
jgi:hypothetical protein